jgi:hypothetical protein
VHHCSCSVEQRRVTDRGLCLCGLLYDAGEGLLNERRNYFTFINSQVTYAHIQTAQSIKGIAMYIWYT